MRTTGTIEVLGQNIFGEDVELVQVRKQVGMVFQRPNPLPLSIRDNVLFGYRLHQPEGRGIPRARRDEIVEDALRQVLLWDAVKDRLGRKATALSLEEQQKLCIARLLPVKPSVLLMDEPCSALDPERDRGGRGADLGAARALHDPHRDAQHGPGPTRQRGVRLHADGQGHRAHADRADVRHAGDKETADYIEGRYG